MAELIEGSQELESTTVGIYRTAAVVKGGRRFSFSALVVVGDRRGRVGIGYAKASGVPSAIEKAQKDARKGMFQVVLQEGTLPHPVNARFGASSVRLLPAAPGTGISAGGTVRAVLELAGVRDCLTKAYGSTNQKNLCKAALEGLKSLRAKSQLEALRGVSLEQSEVDERLELGKKYAPKLSATPKPVAKPTNTRSSGGGRGGKRREGGGRRERQPAGTAASASATSSAESAPPAEGQQA
jgi:small subunit ribosomal protein S5